MKMNKSLTPPKKTPKKTTNLGSGTRSPKSPSKRSRLSDVETEERLNRNVEDKLRHNREKLSHTLDTFTLLIRSKNPIRCLEHNSVISVYCKTDNRLLCSNCVFGKVEHKFHKMLPIDKSYDQVRTNIERMRLPIQKEMQQLNSVKELVLNSLDGEVVDLHATLQTLSLKYTQAHQLLDDSFLRIKNRLMDSLEQLKARHETVALELNFLKELYDVRVPILSQDFDGVDDAQKLLYHHSLLSTICSQKKFEGNIWNSPRSQMRSTGEGQLRRIQKICTQLKSTMFSSL